MTEIRVSTPGLRTYRVQVDRQDDIHAQASAHGHSLTLGVRRGDQAASFNAAETLLAALGACLITNVNALTTKMHLQVEGVRLEIEGDRRDEPPAFIQIRYRLLLDSPEPQDKLEKLHEVAFKWGTVTNTLLNGVAVHGELATENVAQ